MQVQALQPQKANPCVKTGHMTCRSLRSFQLFLHHSSFYPTHKILCFTMLFNRPDTPKSAPSSGGIYTVNHKKRGSLFLTITLANLNRFL